MPIEQSTLFETQLPYHIAPSLVTVGKYNGLEVRLTFITPNGKIVIQTDCQISTDGVDPPRFRRLTVPHAISSLTAGRMDDRDSNRDILFYGSKTGVVAYDPECNVDLFHKDLPNGANCLAILPSSGVRDQCGFIVIGGDCSIVALNRNGAEVFWTATGDSISALTSISSKTMSDSGLQELVCGSVDCTIKVFQNDVILYEITETDAVSNLISLDQGYFGYGLCNGTIGVYNRSTRVWRIKSKCKPVCFAAYDMNQDGSPELICGWNNGKVDARIRATGVIVFKTQMNDVVAGLLVTDYMGYSDILLVCCINGEIRGYSSFNPGEKTSATNEELLRQLSIKKQHLLLELRGLTESGRLDSPNLRGCGQLELCTIPANVVLEVSLSHVEMPDNHCIQLNIRTSNDAKIRCILLFAEGIFPGESHVIHPPDCQACASNYCIQLRPPRNCSVDVFVKAYVVSDWKGQDPHIYPVLTASVLVPQFAMYRPISMQAESEWPSGLTRPRAGVQFALSDRPQRLALWIKENFLINHEPQLSKFSSLSVAFQSLRVNVPNISSGSLELSQQSLNVHQDKSETVPRQNPQSNGIVVINMNVKGEVSLQTEEIELASEMVQSIAKFFNIPHLASTCEFPREFDNFEQLVHLTEAHQATRQQMTSDMAEKMDQIGTLLVRAEDQRLMGCWGAAKQMYTELLYTNRDLLTGYQSRICEHRTLSDCQRRLNQFIQQASSLRVGKFQTKIMSLCHQALQTNNLGAFFKVVRTGVE
ncbi:hypothetical protein EG68_06037 [Paragonimus skrjabini miyazakii]|uniref:Bardet-Biedl syndrome 2 protein homolog n=1 Tax=Paragonimus skrjabini miyazakii TaxID=59628 RepID=A0A8S9YX59_9TREM|nr:hypothetical protein EG68_06037 [Paragonimus skrjabini miyazakii]